MKKISFLIFNLFILSGCVQSTAMLGPALTAASTGNALQTGFSYGANLTIKETTGKNASEHIVDYKAKKKIEKDLKNLLKKHIKLTRKKISLRTKN
jgi:outer membrane lipoprotein-sorting protein